LTVVVDASVAVEYLLRTQIGQRAAAVIDQMDLIAPELLDAEILAVLRRVVIAGRLSETRARSALDDLIDWPVRRLAHAPLIREAWTFRHNVSGYDALYLAAARLHGASVLTADGPLARAPASGVTVENIRP